VAVVSAGQTTTQILTALAQHPGSTSADLARRTGRSVDYVRQVLENHVTSGNVSAARDWATNRAPRRHTLVRMPQFSIAVRVLQLLAVQPCTRAAMARALHCSGNTIGQALSSLLDSGRIVAGPGSNGKVFVYALPTLAQQAAK